MESDSYDSHIDRGIAECNRDISNSVGENNKQNSKSSTHTMPAFEDILKNKATKAYPPVQEIRKEFVSQMVEKISNSQPQDRSGEIPSLDLGRQILAQQRKIASLKRKSPLSTNDSSANKQNIQPRASHISFMSQAPASPQQRIIADIVAKEIMLLTSAR